MAKDLRFVMVGQITCDSFFTKNTGNFDEHD